MTTFARGRIGWKFLFVSILSCLIALGVIPTNLGRVAPADASGTRYSFNRAERCLMRRINQVRMNHGRRPLRADKQLAYVARRHARQMADSGSVYHDGAMGSKVTRWRRLAQNTGRGRSCDSLSRAFMASSTHRQTMLGRYRFVGVGVVRCDGRLFVQEIFESRRDPGNIYHYP